MPKPITVSLDFSAISGIEEFLAEWDKELRKEVATDIVGSQVVAQTMTRFMRSRMVDLLEGDRFAKFMAERTRLDVFPTAKGFRIEISGITEKELFDIGIEGSRYNEDAEQDYNLWAFYEFQGGNASADPTQKSAKAIQKDTGSIIAIRKRAGLEGDGGRKGLIRAVVNQLRGELQMHLSNLVRAALGVQIAAAADRAAKNVGKKTPRSPNAMEGGRPVKKRSRVRGLTRATRSQLRQQENIMERDILRATGGASTTRIVETPYGLRLQGEGGRFVKFAPLRNIRLRT